MELINNGHQNIGIMMNSDKNINCIYRYQDVWMLWKEAQLPQQESWRVVTKFQFEDAYDKSRPAFEQSSNHRYRGGK